MPRLIALVLSLILITLPAPAQEAERPLERYTFGDVTTPTSG